MSVSAVRRLGGPFLAHQIRVDLAAGGVVLEDRIAEVTGVDFTDRAVLDVLCSNR